MNWCLFINECKCVVGETLVALLCILYISKCTETCVVVLVCEKPTDGDIVLCVSDINECRQDGDTCDQGCRDTEGSYECYCGRGFQLAADGHTCNGR